MSLWMPTSWQNSSGLLGLFSNGSSVHHHHHLLPQPLNRQRLVRRSSLTLRLVITSMSGTLQTVPSLSTTVMPASRRRSRRRPLVILTLLPWDALSMASVVRATYPHCSLSTILRSKLSSHLTSPRTRHGNLKHGSRSKIR